MSTTDPVSADPQPPASGTMPQPAAPSRSPLPIIAISLAGLAFILAFAAAGVAWLPAIAAIVLAIIGLVKKLQPPILSLLAVIIAPLAWLIAIVVAIAGFAAGISSTGDSGPVGGAPAVEEEADERPVAEPEEPAADGSSIETPLPFGSTVAVDSWAGKFDVAFGEVNWDATAVIRDENMFNADPTEGMKYIMVPVTMTNTDDEEWSASGTFFWGDIKLVANGRGFSEGAIVVAPDDLSTQGDLYPGGTGVGNVVFEVPADVTSGIWDIDGVFVAA